jgi:uncharacterized membrane protein YidH (DUF202 family)
MSEKQSERTQRNWKRTASTIGAMLATIGITGVAIDSFVGDGAVQAVRAPPMLNVLAVVLTVIAIILMLPYLPRRVR